LSSGALTVFAASRGVIVLRFLVYTCHFFSFLYHVSIVGPGGSGKSQLAFKAIHRYEQEGIFDVVVPIYFDVGLIAFGEFLSIIAEKLLNPRISEFEKHDIEERKSILRNVLGPKVYLQTVMRPFQAL
jgi:hypothetical protein